MLEQAVCNLLFGCGDLQPDEPVLIVHEPLGLGYYDDALVPAVARVARAMGVAVTLIEAPIAEQAHISEALTTGILSHPLTVFFARIGDQIRFTPMQGDQRTIVCYALDLDRFASPFGTLDHRALVALRDRLDMALAKATEIRLTCPAGTDLCGRVSSTQPPKDTHTRRFPQLVYSPLPAVGFSGQIAQNGFLVGTGSRFYAPYACGLSDTLMVTVEGNRITGFHGADAAVAQAHYGDVAAKWGIDAEFIHSWHGGLHPACAFPHVASDSFERWSGAAFGNPRLVHFHTCGAYPPGEISLNIVDPTIIVDGVVVWENGHLRPERVAGGAEVLAACPALAAAFVTPERACGLDATGHLSYASPTTPPQRQAV